MIPSHINCLNIQKSIYFFIRSIFFYCIARPVNDSIDAVVTTEVDRLIVRLFFRHDNSAHDMVHHSSKDIIAAYAT